jgi:glutathione S-transferase
MTGARAGSGRSSCGASRPRPSAGSCARSLCALELPYLLHNVAHGSPKRDGFVARSGKMMVPYLVDPNTDAGMFESADIVRYLEATYAL